MEKQDRVWPVLWARVKAERRILFLSAVIALVLVASGMHVLAVCLFWLVLAVALLSRSETMAPPMPAPVIQANAASKTQMEALVIILNALDMPVLVVAADETVLLQNHADEKAFGTIPQNTYLAARVRSPGILDMVRETIATGKINQIEHSERLPSEAVYIVRVAPAEIAIDGGERLYILSYRDISQARRIDRMRSDFVANASHELRTPLASLRGFIETLQGPARNDVKAHEKFLVIMHEQATRMSRLVDDLLSLSRLELKSHIAPDEKIDLAPLLGHVIDALSPLAQDVDVTIALNVPDGPVFVNGDRDELIEVFENLIENACKYGQEGKKVEVSLLGGEDGRPVEVAVRDFGPGIPAEHVPRITERFYRVNVEASRSKKGTGLGLAIVKHILTRHRARMIVQSEVGKGTLFTVRF
ncbi:phosphate regulon sensor histidine kinase PhoR [Pararhizobium antarcticum]|uniref:histidine kinase n=1 Tax=Pararhizobium antarcticum TaxID=1798805 RepID=A0A657LSE8_9HYPH|nr:phosphate regulon sensor histidine kinase PhoR [Pararhizobium antarcticum]OJF92688.1 histidine kinase [Pararhizobium antarcticum]OJF98519.1 histidine kinase [Rhizobium sp. 58]